VKAATETLSCEGKFVMIVITTPTGDIGRQVLKRVLQGDDLIRVIARDPSRIPEAFLQRVEVFEGSHGNRKVVEKALTGADALFWLIPPEPFMKLNNVDEAYAGFTKPAAEAIKKCGVKCVVAISAIGRGWNNAGLATANIKSDDLLASTCVALRVLAMPSFMDNLLRQAQTIKEKGVFSSPLRANLKMPTVATSDIAEVAAKFLMDATWIGQADVPVLGPEELSQNEMGEILSDVLGKPVRFEQTPMEAYRSRMTSRGMSEAFAQGLADMMTAKNEGMDNTASRTDAADTPTTFRRWSETVLKPAVLR
jgi:uncharacterized protein YbjT (DUF2867 family)